MSRIDWQVVSNAIREKLQSDIFKYAQEKSLEVIAENINERGIIVADEVGMGKTWVALALMDSVIECGGTAAVVVPPGLMFQWQSEYKKFKENGGSFDPVLLRSYWDIYNQDCFLNSHSQPILIPKKRPWCILSHRFGVPQVRGNSHETSYFLPTIINALIIEKNDGSKKLKAYQYYKSWVDYYAIRKNKIWFQKVRNVCRYLSSKTSKLTKTSREFLLDEKNMLSAKNTDANSSIMELFKKGDQGHGLYCELLGLIIGDVDLLIIDEAHKSKDSIESPSKILGELLERILDNPGRRKTGMRRVGLTATPVELGADQWKYLLERIGVRDGSKEKALDEKVRVISFFSTALKNANISPDNRECLDQLITGSKAFQEVLLPCVTRRKRIDQEEMQELIKGSPRFQKSHPHRNISKCLIAYHDLDKEWRRIVLAIEGMGRTAKGLKVDSKMKLSNIRYASGLISFDMTENDELEKPQELSRKHRRMLYYQKLASDLASSNSGSLLWDHPRVVQAARRFEDLLFNQTWGLKSEKILVFGTFTRPMVALRQVMNARFILRQVDNDRPILSSARQRDVIFHQYLFILSGKKLADRCPLAEG